MQGKTLNDVKEMYECRLASPGRFRQKVLALPKTIVVWNTALRLSDGRLFTLICIN